MSDSITVCNDIPESAATKLVLLCVQKKLVFHC